MLFNKIRLFAWGFIFSRLYRIWNLTTEELILMDILASIKKKQLEHIINVQKSSDEISRLLIDNVYFIITNIIENTY